MSGRHRPARADGGRPRPLPDPDQEPYARPFWEGLRDGELRLQTCASCGRRQYYPRPWCRFCGGRDLSWGAVDPAGEVASHTVVREPVLHPAFADEVPYLLAYVDLDAGPRICTRLVDCEASKATRGLRVEVWFERVTDETVLPYVRPA